MRTRNASQSAAADAVSQIKDLRPDAAFRGNDGQDEWNGNECRRSVNRRASTNCASAKGKSSSPDSRSEPL
jgi:hypothetical protein